ncbi:MAG: adenosine deaminase, partial [Proteobacteria bacterium]|nr:adenosine deaminase [Pseudomonadota bacterium]
MTYPPAMKKPVFVLLAVLAGCSQVAMRPSAPAPVDPEQITARYFDSIRASPPRLGAFLRAMPKGADLHNHLSGAIWAEDYLAWAVQDGDCVQRATDKLVAPPCDAASGRRPAADALRDETLYRELVDAWSMRDFVATNGDSGHDHFFDAFDKFHHVAKMHRGDMLARAMHQAAQDNVLYLELMDTLADAPIRDVAANLAWDGDFAHAFAALRPGMPTVLAKAKDELDSSQQRMRAELHCDTAQADAGCQVQVRFLYQVLRGFP